MSSAVSVEDNSKKASDVDVGDKRLHSQQTLSDYNDEKEVTQQAKRQCVQQTSRVCIDCGCDEDNYDEDDGCPEFIDRTCCISTCQKRIVQCYDCWDGDELYECRVCKREACNKCVTKGKAPTLLSRRMCQWCIEEEERKPQYEQILFCRICGHDGEVKDPRQKNTCKDHKEYKVCERCFKDYKSGTCEICNDLFCGLCLYLDGTMFPDDRHC